jgi:hypothetical protein
MTNNQPKFNALFDSYEDVDEFVYERGNLSVLYVNQHGLKPAGHIITTAFQEALEAWASEVFLPTDKLTLILWRSDYEGALNG